MTFEARVRAVAAKHFTERQARFLVTVMLHSGVCMVRQYCAFGGMVYGQVARDFFARLMSEKLATAFDCAHKRARIYHLHHRALYEAIGEPHTRLRKPVTLGRAVERVMVLDAVLASRDLTWLATEREKVEHFSLRLGSTLSRSEFPHLTFGAGRHTTRRYFPDRFPIGVDADGRRHVFLYLVTREAPVDFRAFLQRHAELFRALPEWTVRILVPTHLASAGAAHAAACEQELARPLRSVVVEELRWYFEEHRRLGTGQRHRATDDATRYARSRQAFRAPRYRALYRHWTRVGEGALDTLTSPVLADAVQRGRGRIECHPLPRPYLHLSSLVGTA
ncbi:MAG: hypothetical protein AB7I23_02960 [Vicinamibacterales bacterium]